MGTWPPTSIPILAAHSKLLAPLQRNVEDNVSNGGNTPMWKLCTEVKGDSWRGKRSSLLLFMMLLLMVVVVVVVVVVVDVLVVVVL